MATGRRIPREKATAALTALLERVCAGGPHADCVTAVYVFGSYARGALAVGDVDSRHTAEREFKEADLVPYLATLTEGAPLPTLRALIASGRRMIVFDEDDVVTRRGTTPASSSCRTLRSARCFAIRVHASRSAAPRRIRCS
jgi:hypothetical protein